MLTASIVACKTHRCSVSEPSLAPTTIHDTVHHTNTIHDSVLQYRDRLVRMLGDTIYIRDSVILRKIVHSHDSIFIHKTDTIPYKVTVYKQVRYIPSWCKWLGGIGLLCLVILLIRLFYR